MKNDIHWDEPMQINHFYNDCFAWVFCLGRMNMRAEEKEKTQKLTEKVLNHQVQGEVYILTQGRIWKAIVLRYFNKVQRKEMTVMELVQILETKFAVKYTQKHSLIRYPVEACLKFIAKIANKPLDIKE
jgi:hypothetical protein